MGKVGDLLELFRKIDRMLSLEEKHGKAIEALQEGQSDLRARMTTLEAGAQMLVVKAKSAARTASSQVTQASLADLSRRLGRMEAETETRRASKSLPAMDIPVVTKAPPSPKPQARRKKLE